MEEIVASPTPVEEIQKTPEAPAKKQVAQEFWKYTWELVKTVLIVGISAYVIRVYMLQPFVVDGMSMYPILHNHDYLLVDKLTYNIRAPRRGDIVVFRYPKDPTYNYVKRIIAVPGERVSIKDSKVTVFNDEHPQGFVLNEPYIEAGNDTLPNGASSQSEFTVGTDQFFVLGDNREGSSDSRDWGMLPKNDLIGRVLILAYPLDRTSITPHADY